MAKVKKSKSISARELKAWLHGIEEFQPKEWVPSKEQWDTIRKKIENLEELEAVQEDYHRPNAPRQPEYYAPRPAADPTYVAGPLSAPLAGNAGARDAGGVAVLVSPTDSGIIAIPAGDSENGYKSGFA